MDRSTVQKILIIIFLLAIGFLGLETFNVFGFKDIFGSQLKPGQLSSSRMSYGRFLDYLEMGWVKQVDLYDNSRNATVQASSPELGNRPQLVRVEMPIGTSQFIEKFKEYNIDFDAHPVPRKSIFLTIASNLFLPLVFIVGLFFFFQNSDTFPPTIGGAPMSFIKSPAKFKKEPRTGISFTDIAGVEEAKADFEEIVSFLKEPERYTLVGARIPKGVLLIGPPGTGKTLLAKAIANEANVPFYNISGSEFVEMFIGIGAARVRDLFEKAAKSTPCIIFIDEIDAVGRERGAGIGGGNDEREQTLNQLLTEMDGFRENQGVIVVGATNRIDIIDRALLRPGRFDRQITVGLPDRLGRIGILKIHAQSKPIDKNVSLAKIANRTAGFSGADLANLLNESAVLAARYKKESITRNEVNEAADRIIAGIIGASMEDTKNKKLVAYHEVGHAIVGSALKNHDKVEKITLIPRGGAKGLTWFAPEEDQILITRSQLVGRIISTLGGRATEEVIFSNPEITTGASNDLRQATKIARRMVTRYGMSSLGPIALENENNELILSKDNFDENQTMKNKITAEVSEIVNDCEKVALEIVFENRAIIDLIVEKLLDAETIDGDEFRKLVSEYTILLSEA